MLTNSEQIDFTKDSRAASCWVGLFDVVNLRTKSDTDATSDFCSAAAIT